MTPARGPKGSLAQGLIVMGFVGLVGAAAAMLPESPQSAVELRTPAVTTASAELTASTAVDPAEAQRCAVPAMARLIGHEEKWLLQKNLWASFGSGSLPST